MSAETLQAIDDAVRAHLSSLLEGIDTAPVVTGWVIAAEVQTLEDGEVMWDNDYATGETTSPNTALGLSTWLSDALRGIQADGPDEDPDDG